MESQIKKIHQQLTSKQISCTALVQEKLTLLKRNTYNTVNSLLSNMQILTTKVNRLSKKYARTTSAQFHSFNRIVQIPVHAVGFLRKQFTKLF